jgi:lysophospholipase L1-like esterase
MKIILRQLGLILVVILTMCREDIAQDPARFQAEIDRFKSDTTDYTAVRDLVLFTGSSTIRIWTGLAADFPQYHILNRGFGGSEMSDLLYYADTLILSYHPSMVFIYEGDNDLADGKDPAEIAGTARKLLRKIRSELPDIPVIFFSAKPSPSRWRLKDAYLDFNARLKRLAERNRNVYYLDLWDPMLGKDGQPLADIFQDDRLHMNRKGYDIWKDIVGRFLVTLK